MIVRKMFLVAMLAVLAVAAAPSRASADWYITPFIGGNFGGNADFNGVGSDFEDQVERRMDLGASLGWMGAGIAGFELDFGWSPNFFQDTTGSGDFTTGDSNVTSLMANIVLGVPVGGQTGGGVRPYVVGGVGLLRSNISAGGFLTDDLTSNDFGFDLGGGLHGYFNDHVGLRGDIRYFRLLQDNEPSPDDLDIGIANFNFWRATIGVTFRFGN